METWNISIFSGRSPGRRTLRSPSTGGRRARAEDSAPRLERGGAAGLAEGRGIGNRIGDSQEAAAGAAIVMVHGDRMEGSGVDRIGDGEAHHARSVMHRRRPGPLHIEAAGAGAPGASESALVPRARDRLRPSRTSAPRVAGHPGGHPHDSGQDAAAGPRAARRATGASSAGKRGEEVGSSATPTNTGSAAAHRLHRVGQEADTGRPQ